MKKFVKVVSTVTAAALVAGASAMPAFAAEKYVGDDVNEKYVNSVGSVAADIGDDIEEEIYGSAVTGKDYSQQKESEYQEITGDQAGVEVDVRATQASGEDIYDEYGNVIDGSITALIPKVIILDGAYNATNEYTGEYVVKVKGNIAGDEYVSVQPVSNTTAVNGGGATLEDTKVQFYMGQTNKDDIIATVEQNDVNFGYAALTETTETGVIARNTWQDGTTDTGSGIGDADSNDAITVGTVTAKNVSAGSWHGTFNFNIKLAKGTVA